MQPYPRPLLALALVLAVAPAAAQAQEAATAPTAAAPADAPAAPPPVAPGAPAYLQSAAPAAAAPAPAPATAAAAVTAPAFPTYAAACELGFSLSEGNTSNRTATGGCTAARTGEVWTASFAGKVRFGQSRFGGPKYAGGLDHPRGDFLDTENNFDVALREERALTESKSQYLFAIEGLAGDPFKGYWQRLDAELGYGYAFLNREDASLKLELGGQYNRDYLVKPDPDNNLQVDRYGGVLTLLGRKTLNEMVLVEGKLSYMPNLEDPKTDYRATGDLALTAKLSDKLSFKSAAAVAYNNVPPMVTPLDKTGAKIVAPAGAPAVPDVPARKTDVTWNNLLVVTIF
jgi:putative salt-induced outer membrane protein YdiY